MTHLMHEITKSRRYRGHAAYYAKRRGEKYIVVALEAKLSWKDDLALGTRIPSTSSFDRFAAARGDVACAGSSNMCWFGQGIPWFGKKAAAAAAPAVAIIDGAAVLGSKI